MSGEPDRAARSRRRLLIPIVTIAVAAAIFGWSRWTAPQRADEIRLLVTTLLADAGGPQPRRGGIDGTDPILAPTIRDAMESVRTEGERQASAIGIDVQLGDAPGGDGSASHHAVVAIGGQPHTTLRIRHGGSAGIRIIGVLVHGGEA